MRRTAVINVVGLTESVIGPQTPRINAFLKRGACAKITPSFPAVTCTAQSTYLTGSAASDHGIVGNGWYDRELAEVHFWKQSNHLVHGKKLWEDLRDLDAKFTCAKLFWWYNMYSSADYSITPRPMYPADGRKVFDIYSWPYAIRPAIKKDLGEFPFPAFWGPGAGVQTPNGAPDAVSRWIASAAMWIEQKHQPTLSLIYLPHLDYNFQRHAPFIAAGAAGQVVAREAGAENDLVFPAGARKVNPVLFPDLQAIDNIVGDLIEFFERQSVQVVLLSEYGLTPVRRPVHLNRLFRKEGWLVLKEELGRELIDFGTSKVFAVADHQVAHIYLNDTTIASRVRSLLESTEGIEAVMGFAEKKSAGIAHGRAGDFIATADAISWFTYFYWLEDRAAPDFARTVDIHRKPGYDPVELFLNPKLTFPKAKILSRLLQKKLGFRMLMDVIPLDATLVKGSHGRRPDSPEDYPVMISQSSFLTPNSTVQATEVYELLKRQIKS